MAENNINCSTLDAEYSFAYEKQPLNSGNFTRSMVDLLAGFVQVWMAKQRFKWQVAKERRALSELPTELLNDIGLSQAQAAEESRRAAHDVPKRRLSVYLNK